MHVISPKKLREFWAEHAEAEVSMRAWLAIVEKKRYANPHELHEDFNHADFVGDRRTIFDVGGNHYRISADVRYDQGRIYVRRVMTHEEYDRRSRNDTL